MRIRTSVIFLFMFIHVLNAITFRAEVPAGTKECYIVGINDDWVNFIQMIPAGNNIFEITITNITDHPGAIQYCSGPGWDYEEVDINGHGVAHYWQPMNTVGQWKSLYEPADIIHYQLYCKQDLNYYELNNYGEQKEVRTVQYPDDNNSFIQVLAWKEPIVSAGNKSLDYTKVSVQDNRIILNDFSGLLHVYSSVGELLQVDDVTGSFLSRPLNKGCYFLIADQFRTKILILE
ncbi:MAG: hypothetical protein BWY08_01787 [Bacteroidetes bacterium ADurb.Bin174]|nr:MAG: hypothetical protein BWY08_01787 [Bacteroidetes bacterium ADurb.Bin174]